MPDISGLIAAQMARNREETESGQNLMTSITDSIRQQGARTFQQDAIEFFKDGNVSTQRLQEFSRKYPNVDPAETWKVASSVASQAKAQKIRDYGSTIAKLWKEKKSKGEDMTEDDFKSVIPPEDAAEFMPHMEAFSKFFKPEIQVFEKGKKYIKDGKDITPTWPAEEKVPKEKPRNIDMTDPTGKTVYQANEDEAALLEAKGWTKGKAQFAPEKPEKPETGSPHTIYGPNGQTKIVFIKKGEEYNPPDKWSLKAPGEPDKPDKPERVAYRDTADGSIKYYDKNNPQDRKTLEKYGNQLVPLAENPIQNIIRQGVQGAAQSPASVQATPKKDSFGYVLGETQKGKDGKQYKYIGNDKWQKL